MIEISLNHVYAWAYFSVGPMILIYFGINGLIEYRRSSSFIKNLQEIMGTKPSLKDQLTTWLGYSLAGLIILAAWPVFVIWAGHQKWKERQERLEDRKPKFYCKSEYLISEVTPNEAERNSYIVDPLGMSPEIAFGHLNKAWCNFLSELEPTDELWLFLIPPDSMTGKTYVRTKETIQGYARIRRKKIVGEFVFQSD